MKIKGINYDVGTIYGNINSRPNLTKKVMKKELSLIKNKLNCNAVRIYGEDVSKLIDCSKIALEKRLEVWISPRFRNKTKEETLKLVKKVAVKAEKLRKKYKKVVFIVGNELTIDSKGFIPGKYYHERVNNLFNKRVIKYGPLSNKLNKYLEKLVENTSKIFKGKITYASGDWERVNWKLFDIVGVNKYLNKSNKNRYVLELKDLKKIGKPIAITEFGCATFVGAKLWGGGGWHVLDLSRIGIEKCYKKSDISKIRIKEGYKRSEKEQANYIKNLLKIFEREKIYASFIFTFIQPNFIHNPNNPRRDLDIASFGIVKTFEDGHFEPKKAFYIIKERYK